MQFKLLALISLMSLVGSSLAKPVPMHNIGVPGVKHIVPIRDASSVGANNASLACASSPTPGDITYHGGPVINGTFNTYGIFYGHWKTTQRNLLTNILSNIGATPYYNILKSYKVNGGVAFKTFYNDAKYSQGKALNDNKLPLVVQNALKNGLPVDTNGIYFIFTDSNVTETNGFCSQYCGFHTNGVINGQKLLYAFIGNPQSCLAGCSPCNAKSSPNNDLGVDAMASILSHELVEAASDPLGNAWFDVSGYENADKCAYTYGKTYKTANGALANVNWGGKDYLVQQNWDATTQSCALSA